jgi:hypothetical protein
LDSQIPSDVKPEAMAFAFYIDNNASVARADWFDFGKLRNIDWLENQVGYDFFANIPTSVQNVIESYRVSDIRGSIQLTSTPSYLDATENTLSAGISIKQFFSGHFNVPGVFHDSSSNLARPSRDSMVEYPPNIFRNHSGG